jgi:hypothetical protein
MTRGAPGSCASTFAGATFADAPLAIARDTPAAPKAGNAVFRRLCFAGFARAMESPRIGRQSPLRTNTIDSLDDPSLSWRGSVRNFVGLSGRSCQFGRTSIALAAELARQCPPTPCGTREGTLSRRPCCRGPARFGGTGWATSVDQTPEEDRCVPFPLSYARYCRPLLRRRKVNPAIDCPVILLTAPGAPTSRRKARTSDKATPARLRPLRAAHLRKARKGSHPPVCRQLPKDPPKRSLIQLRCSVDPRFGPQTGDGRRLLADAVDGCGTAPPAISGTRSVQSRPFCENTRYPLAVLAATWRIRRSSGQC